MFFAFNFNPNRSFDGYFIRNADEGIYTPIMSTEALKYGGDDRVAMDCVYKAETAEDGNCGFKIYLPSRSAICLKKEKIKKTIPLKV